MKYEHTPPKVGSSSFKSLDERFARRPLVYQRLQQIADGMDQAIADGYTADQAEEMAVEQVGRLGADILGDWARAQSEESVRKAQEEHSEAIKCGKKNSSGIRPSEP
jgi:hypothetical protein